MINRVIEAVSMAITSAYPSADIFDKYVPQGITEGSFTIHAEQVDREQLLKKRRRLSVFLTVTYFPEDPDDTREMLTVAESLEELLDMVTWTNGNSYKGHNMNWAISDHTLVFMVDYALFLNTTEADALMETLELTEDIADG